MARTGTEASSVRKGLADRMKPKPKQAASAGGGGTNYSARFQNPGAGSNRARTVRDPSRFQNRGGGQPAPTTRPASTVGATRPVGQTTIHGGFKGATATAGAGYGRPGSRFGQWQPRTAVAAPRAAPMQPVPPRQPMQTAQAAPQQVPGQYATPGRPMAPMAPQMAQAAPMPQPMPQMAQPAYPQPMPQMAQPVYPQPMPQVAQPYYPQPVPQPAQPVYPQQYYNPTPYTGR